jgi:alpha-L-rhamnosidase
VFIPTDREKSIKENNRSISSMDEIKIAGSDSAYVELHLGSGSYHFTASKIVDSLASINLNEYVGKYKIEGGIISSIEIKLSYGKLKAKVFANSGEIDPVKNVKDQFTSADGSLVIFTRDKKGKVVKIKMNSLGMNYEGVKE